MWDFFNDRLLQIIQILLLIGQIRLATEAKKNSRVVQRERGLKMIIHKVYAMGHGMAKEFG